MSAKLERLELRSMMSGDSQAAMAPEVRDVQISDVVQDGESWMHFEVKWFSEDGIDRSTIDSTDLRVVTPYGDNFQVRLKRTLGSGDTDVVRAEYKIRAINGLWGEEDNGTYSIRLRADSIYSKTGRASVSETIAQFQVDVETSMSANDPFDVQLAWSNFHADEWIPQSVVDQFNRPIWMNEAQWGFSNVTLGASVGNNASNTAVVDAAFDYAEAHGSIVVVDVETSWPVYSDWWYGGTGVVTQTKRDLIQQHAADALEFIQAVAGRKPDGVKLAAYLPNGLFWGGRDAFEELIVQDFVGSFTPYLDTLVVDIYRHPNDHTPEIYGQRVHDVIESYQQLDKPIFAITWPNAQGPLSDEFRVSMIEGVRDAGADGVMIWDDPSREWTPTAARSLSAFLSAKTDGTQNRGVFGSLPTIADPEDRQSVWNELWLVA